MEVDRLAGGGGAVLHIAVVGKVGQFQRRLGRGRPRPGAAAAGRVAVGGVQRRLNVRQRGVDVVGHGELQHTAHDAPHAQQHRDVVVRRARVGVHVGAVHHDLHQLAGGGVAGRGRQFFQVVGPGGQALLLVGEHPCAAQRGQVALVVVQVAGGHDVKELCVGVHHAVVYVLSPVQGKGRAGQGRQVVLGQLLHEQIVLDVGHVQMDRKFPREGLPLDDLFVVQPHDAFGGCFRQAGGVGAVEADGVLGVVLGRLAVFFQHAVIGQDVAGQVLDGVLVRAAAVQHKDVRVVAGGFQHGGVAGRAGHPPPVDGVARYRVPVALVAAAVAGGVLPFKHHRKVGAGVGAVGVALQVLHHVGHRHGHGGVGVGAGAPWIAGKQRGQIREVVGKVQFDVAGGAVAGRHEAFPQQKAPGASGAVVAVFQVVQAQQGAVGVLEHERTVVPGHAGGDPFFGPVRGQIVQVELRAAHGVAGLVHFDQVALRDRNKVEFELHVGSMVAPLQIEELERVVCIVGKGGGPAGPRLACGQKLFLQGAVGRAVDLHLAGLEIDGQRRRVVDAAQIPHQHVVDEHPHVVVARKLVGHRGAAGGAVHGAAGHLDKAGRHRHAEIVIDGAVFGVHVAHLGVVVEGEELPPDAGRTAAIDAGAVVQDKGVRGRVILGKVFGAVVVEVVLGVDLQQAAHLREGRLAVGRQGRVEQIIQRLPAFAQHRVAVLQSAVHHAGAGRGAAGVVVQPVALPRRDAEPQHAPGVDALVHVGRVHVVRRVAGGDPVVEQIDRGADGADRVGHRAFDGRKRCISRFLGRLFGGDLFGTTISGAACSGVAVCAGASARTASACPPASRATARIGVVFMERLPLCAQQRHNFTIWENARRLCQFASRRGQNAVFPPRFVL